MPKVSFAVDIKPLFRAIDIAHMKPFVELDNYHIHVEYEQCE